MPSTTTFMGLTTWPAPDDFFDHAALVANFNAIDAHDHSSGKGTQISGTGLASDAVSTIKITDGAVTTAKILDAAVTTAKIPNGAIKSTSIGASEVKTTNIADANVTTAKILDANITTAKLAAAAVTSAKFKPTFDVVRTTNTFLRGGPTTPVVVISIPTTPVVASTSIVIAMCNVLISNGGGTGADMRAHLTLSMQVDGVSQTNQPVFNWEQIPTEQLFGDAGALTAIWSVPLTAASHTLTISVAPDVQSTSSGFSAVVETYALHLQLAQ